VPADRVRETLGALQQRGPDGEGVFRFDAGKVSGVLLHTRLSIIDLDDRAAQPMTRHGCTVVFNGEIYNYVEIRRKLVQKGVVFTTKSDTEVLLQAYLAGGDAFTKELEGMWALAIWDSRRERLLLSRDRFGEKPLYYTQAGDGIYFGSQTNALREITGKIFQVNQQQILRYLVQGYKSLYKHGETFYKDIHEVPHATTLTITDDLNISPKRYWVPRYGPQERSLSESVDATRHALISSMRMRLRSDVPMAFCLSGGVDSGALASIAAKKFGQQVATFSIIDPDERYDEKENIDATVRDIGPNHTEVLLNPKEITLESLEELVAYHDAPIATITYFIHSFLSREISKAGYKVVFSGTSADELFTGYYDHWIWHLLELRGHKNFANLKTAWKKHILPGVRNPLLRDLDRYFTNPDERGHIYLHDDVFAGYMRASFREGWSEEYFCDSPLRNRTLNELFHEATPVILHEDDLNSMMYSLENRSPYLDTKLFEVALTTPIEHLMMDGYAKFPLRAAMKGILNDQVRLDRRKRGFNASIHSILDLDLPESRDMILSNSPIFDIVRRDKIEALLGERPLPNSFSKFLFNFINAKFFLP